MIHFFYIYSSHCNADRVFHESVSHGLGLIKIHYQAYFLAFLRAAFVGVHGDEDQDRPEVDQGSAMRFLLLCVLLLFWEMKVVIEVKVVLSYLMITAFAEVMVLSNGLHKPGMMGLVYSVKNMDVILHPLKGRFVT